MYSVRAGCVSVGMGVRPLIARLCQHIVFSIRVLGFTTHCLLSASLRSSTTHRRYFTATFNEMGLVSGWSSRLDSAARREVRASGKERPSRPLLEALIFTADRFVAGLASCGGPTRGNNFQQNSAPTLPPSASD